MLSTNPDLADYWTTMTPVQDYAHLALSKAREKAEKEGVEHPESLRHIVGLREGWEDVLAASRAERAAANQQADDADDQQQHA